MEQRIQHAKTKDGVGMPHLFAVFRGNRLAVLLTAVLLLALLAAACDGDGDDRVGEDPLQGLRALADNATEGATAKVAYTVTTTTNDDMTESEQVVAQRPPDSRLDVAVAADGDGQRSTVINRGDTLYVCLATGGQENCLELQPSGGSVEEALAQATLHLTVESPSNIELFDMPRQLIETAGEITSLDTSQRRIAGLDATCFREQAPNAETELCFSGEGLTLYWRYSQVSPDGTMRVFEATATSVSTDVADRDFEPPYEIIEGSRFEIPVP